jgi:hypothetical protein
MRKTPRPRAYKAMITGGWQIPAGTLLAFARGNVDDPQC